MTTTEEFPFELKRGGIIWGVDREITDDDTAAMFVIDGEVAPRLWAAQTFPVIGDTLNAEAVGIDGDTIRVEERLWQSANLVLIGCVHFDVEISRCTAQLRSYIAGLEHDLARSRELRTHAIASAGDAIRARELATRRTAAAADVLVRSLVDASTSLVLQEVAVERVAQDRRWGEQNHPSFRPGLCYGGIIDEPHARAVCEGRTKAGILAYADFLTEEYFEVMGTNTSSDDGDEHGNDVETRSELVQLAAVSVAMIEAIDRRAGGVTQ